MNSHVGSERSNERGLETRRSGLSVNEYLQLAKLLLLGREVVEPRAALVHRQLGGIQALVERLGARLEIFHLRQDVLEHTDTCMKSPVRPVYTR